MLIINQMSHICQRVVLKARRPKNNSIIIVWVTLPLRKSLFFSPPKYPLHLCKNTFTAWLCTCNIFGSWGGEKKTHSLSNFMFCSPAKVKVWQKWTQSLPLATITFHLGADGFPDCITVICNHSGISDTDVAHGQTGKWKKKIQIQITIQYND